MLEEEGVAKNIFTVFCIRKIIKINQQLERNVYAN